MHAGQVNGFLIGSLIGRRFGIDVADQRQLRKELAHVLELSGKGGQLI